MFSYLFQRPPLTQSHSTELLQSHSTELEDACLAVNCQKVVDLCPLLFELLSAPVGPQFKTLALFLALGSGALQAAWSWFLHSHFFQVRLKSLLFLFSIQEIGERTGAPVTQAMTLLPLLLLSRTPGRSPHCQCVCLGNARGQEKLSFALLQLGTVACTTLLVTSRLTLREPEGVFGNRDRHPERYVLANLVTV